MKHLRLLILFITVMTIMAAGAPAVFGDENTSGSGDEAITVYVTITNDSDFVTGTDGTVMAHVPMTLKYFDLADYGLENYYRLDDDDEVIEQPTVLHLLIRVCEKYYARRKMTADDVHSNIINVTGAPKSVWLDRFWGHDGNLMYFVNNMYPLMSEKWGATCDYILLEDGDEIEMALYTDWSFYTSSAFLFFEGAKAEAVVGQEITMKLLANPTSVVNDGVYRGSVVMANEPIRVSGNRGKTWMVLDEKSGADGTVSVTFDSPGVYYIASGPKHVNYKDAAPAIAIIAVSDSAEEAARLLAEAKSTAKTALEQYKAASDYRDAEKEQLASLIAEGGAAIDDAASIDAVETVLTNYKGKIDALKTAAEYEEEEQAAEEAARQEAARLLAESKSTAKTALEQYKTASDYRDAEKEQLASLIAEGGAAIDDAASTDAVDTVLASYKEKIDGLKTAAEYEKEEQAAEEEKRKQEEEAARQEAAKKLAEAKSSAKTELENYKAVSDYRDDEQKQLQMLVTEGSAAVDSAGSVERITVILEEYKGKIDKLKTAAEYEAEEAAAEEERKKKEQEAEEERKRQEEADRAAREAAEKAAKEAAEKAARELAVKNADVLLDEAAEYEEKSSGYTEASYTEYCEAVEELKTLIGDEKASAKEIEAASEKVRTAAENLKDKEKQPMKVTARKKTYKKNKLKSKALTFRAVTVKKAKGAVTYKASASGKSKKVIKFNAKTQKVTVKKGTGKGTYKIRIKVTAGGNGEFLAGKKTVIVKVRVR